jgi:hypothetical protein
VIDPEQTPDISGTDKQRGRHERTRSGTVKSVGRFAGPSNLVARLEEHRRDLGVDESRETDNQGISVRNGRRTRDAVWEKEGKEGSCLFTSNKS